MGLEINTIITLENNEKYQIINENLYNGKKYFLANNINSNTETIFEEELEGLDIYVREVLDKEMYGSIIGLLK
ncbi:MAG: hypothetical protein HFJ02_03120 [Bacilli bacterium]|nr:hypothetical protein [Bacilli bacterium]